MQFILTGIVNSICVGISILGMMSIASSDGQDLISAFQRDAARGRLDYITISWAVLVPILASPIIFASILSQLELGEHHAPDLKGGPRHMNGP